MTDSDSGVPNRTTLHKQGGKWFAHQIGSTKDNHSLAGWVMTAPQQQLLNGGWRARHNARCSLQEETHIQRVLAVNVFLRQNRLDDCQGIEVPGERLLHKEPVEAEITVEIGNKTEQIALWYSR
jgi:hypothetical protein